MKLNLTNVTDRALRYSKRGFDIYAKRIADVLTYYPNNVILDCAGRSPETVANRFRDAVRGCVKYGYTAEGVDPRRLSAIAESLSVSIQDRGVVVGLAVNKFDEAIAEKHELPLTIRGFKADVIMAAAVLLHNQVITVVRLFDCDETTVRNLIEQSACNVAVSAGPNDYLILV